MTKKLTIFLFLFTNLFFCSAVEVNLWATTDIHGCIISQRGGMAKIAAVLAEKRTPNDILIDVGDLIQGSYTANISEGAIVLNAFNAMNYDIFVPGNHDFEFGINALRRNLAAMKAEILCCNWQFKELLGAMKPYTVIVRNGIKIGFIGAGERFSRQRLLPTNQLTFANEEMSIARAVTELRRHKVDLIVLVRHGGIYFSGGSLYKLLKFFPEIDIVIGGHSHQLEKGRRIASAYYVQPDAFGRGISRINIDFDEKSRKIRRITSQYFESANYAPAADMQSVLAAEKKLHKTGYKTFHRKIAEKFKNTGEAQRYLLLHALDNEGVADVDIFFADKTGDFNYNKLNRYTVYRLFPYENKIVTIPVSLKEYEIILNECRKYAQKYKIPLILRDRKKDKKHFVLRTVSFVLSGGGMNFPAARNIAEKKSSQIKEFSSPRRAVEKFLSQD